MKKALSALALAGAVIASLALASPAQATVTNPDGGDGPVLICHATASGQYVPIRNILKSTVVHAQGHGISGVNEGDIIPPIELIDVSGSRTPLTYGGNNWTESNSSLWANGCKAPSPTSTGGSGCSSLPVGSDMCGDPGQTPPICTGSSCPQVTPPIETAHPIPAPASPSPTPTASAAPVPTTTPAPVAVTPVPSTTPVAKTPATVPTAPAAVQAQRVDQLAYTGFDWFWAIVGVLALASGIVVMRIARRLS